MRTYSRHASAGDGAIAAAIRCLNRAGILALKGLGGFYLCCRAEDAEAVGRLRTSKFRPSKPLAVMVRTIAEAEIFCRVDRVEAALLEALEAPITLLRKRQDVNGLAPEIAPQNGYVGVMLPYTPLHHLLMAAAKGPLVMTSGNPSGEPLCTENVEARERLAGLVDGFLFHDRPIARRCDDSVMFVAGLPDRDVVQPVRRSRGLVPMPVWLPEGLELQKKLVVVGGDLKNVSAVAEGREVFLTPHIGDLGHPMVRPEQGRAIADLERLFQIQPEAVVCDLHPDYAGTRYARDRAGREEIPLIEVQHHHAHIAGCLAENGCLGPAIGLGFDGTGYGCDGHIWGGEVLLADLENFDRIFHLEYLPLPGGDAAIRQPHRIAIAYLHELMPGLDMADLFPNVSAREIDVIKTMLERHVNTPLTSSAGRLFDSVSALLGLCYEVTHEAQAAIALEAEALRSTVEGPLYTFSLEEGQIRLGKLFNGLVGDLSNGVSVRDIARRFHLTLAEMAVEAARAVRAEQNCLNTVALSGGVWQNRLLLEMAVAALEQKGFDVLLHHSVPANDGGLAYGQAAVAAAVLKAK